MGARLDILFKNETDELGSCEVGKDCIITVDSALLRILLIDGPGGALNYS